MYIYQELPEHLSLNIQKGYVIKIPENVKNLQIAATSSEKHVLQLYNFPSYLYIIQ